VPGLHPLELGLRLHGEQVELRVGHRAQPARRARRVVEVEGVDLRRAVEQRAPHDHPRVVRRSVAVEREAAHARADPVGADDDVVARARAVGQLDIAAGVQRLHGRAEAHARARGLGGIEQDRVKRPAHDPDRARVPGWPGPARRGRSDVARRMPAPSW
jgi:hypothetical protein